MDATNPMTPENQQKRVDSRRKRKAILAGGVVLGLGAAVTLAAWSDNVFASGEFSTGDKFVLLAATDGSGFDRHADEDSMASLEFSVTNLTPGVVAYAPLAIKTTDDSVGGTITALNLDVASTGLAPALEYTVRHGGETCNASGVNADSNGAVLVAQSPVANGPATLVPPEAEIAGAGEATLELCIEVTIPQENQDLVVKPAEGDAGASIIWDFVGTASS